MVVVFQLEVRSAPILMHKDVNNAGDFLAGFAPVGGPISITTNRGLQHLTAISHSWI